MIGEAQIEAMATHLVAALTARGSIKAKAEEWALIACVVELFSTSFERETRIEDEAERMAEEQARRNPGVDATRLRALIKQRLARDQGFTLLRHANRISEEGVLFLAREALSRMRAEGLAEIPNFTLALRHARELVGEWNVRGDAVDLAVRRKIASLSRRVAEGSTEWNILYRRYRDEELRKKGPRN